MYFVIFKCMIYLETISNVRSWFSFASCARKAGTRQRSCWDRNWYQITLDVGVQNVNGKSFALSFDYCNYLIITSLYWIWNKERLLGEIRFIARIKSYPSNYYKLLSYHTLLYFPSFLFLFLQKRINSNFPSIESALNVFQPRLSIGQFDQTFKFPKNFTVSIIRFKEIFLTQFNCYLAPFNSDPYQIFNSNQILQLRTVYVSRETIVTNVFVEHAPNLLIVVGLFPIKIYFKRIRRKITGNVSLISINELGNVDRRARNRERKREK